MANRLTALDDETIWQEAEAIREEIRELDAEGQDSGEARCRLMAIEIERSERTLDAYRTAEARLDGPEREQIRTKIAVAEQNLEKWKRGEFARDNTPTARIGT